MVLRAAPVLTVYGAAAQQYCPTPRSRRPPSTGGPRGILLRACYPSPYRPTVSRYEVATAYPALTYGISLRGCYGMSGTDLGYGATRLPPCSLAPSLPSP
eukprot:2464827-Rhodomonas_salina.1